MDETLFELWCGEREFAFKSTPKKIKEVWEQLVSEYDIPDEEVAKIIEKLLTVGMKEGM